MKREVAGVSIESVDIESGGYVDRVVRISYDGFHVVLDWPPLWCLELAAIKASRAASTPKAGVVAGDQEVVIWSLSSGLVGLSFYDGSDDVSRDISLSPEEAIQFASALREVHFDGSDYEDAA